MKSSQVKFCQKIITKNGIKQTEIKVPQFNSNNSDRLKCSKNNNIISDYQSDNKDEEKQTNFENINM